MLALAAALAVCCPSPEAVDAHAFARTAALAGPRPAGGAGERRVQERLAQRFRSAGLRVATDVVPLLRGGRSRNVIGIRDTPADCLVVVMAHADTVPPSPGAEDNASGLGVLAELAPVVVRGTPACDTWLVATGAEERLHTGSPDHLGSLALVRRVKRRGRARDLRFALTLDEVGRGARFRLRSPVPSTRASVEGRLLSAARRAGVSLDWQRDAGSGNSDHREFELAGLPGMKLGTLDNPCRHEACDTAGRLQRAAFARALRLVVRAL